MSWKEEAHEKLAELEKREEELEGKLAEMEKRLGELEFAMTLYGLTVED